MKNSNNKVDGSVLRRAGMTLALVVPLLGGCGGGGGGGDAPEAGGTSAGTSSSTTTSSSARALTNGFEVWDFNYTSNDGKTGKMCIRFNSGSDTDPPIYMSSVFFEGYQEAGDLTGTVDAAGNVSMTSGTLGATFTATVDAAATVMSGTYTGMGATGSGSFSGGRVMGKHACFWETFGDQEPLDIDAANNAKLPALAMDGDRPVVAFVEEVRGAPVNGIIPVEYRIHVKRWSGTQWQQLGGMLNVDANNMVSRQPRLAVRNGMPVVAWSELNKATQVDEAYAKRWDGTQWAQLGGVLNVSATQNTYAMGAVIDANDRPVVMLSHYDKTWQVWVTRGMQWSGSAWTQLGGDSLNDYVLHTTQDGAGAPAYVSASGLTLGAERWNATSGAWEGLGFGSILGGNDAAELAFTGSGAPVIASWGSGVEGFDVNTVGTNGYWAPLIPGVAYDPANARWSPHIASDPSDGRVVVSAAGSYDVIVQKAYADRWKQVGGQFNDPLAVSETSPVLVFDSTGKLYAVSTQQLSYGNGNIVIRAWPSQQ